MIGLAAVASKGVRGIELRTIVLALGSMVGFVVIFAIFGKLLPDTAVAKANTMSGVPFYRAAIGSLRDIVAGHLAASSFGAMVVITWLVSSLYAIRDLRYLRFVVVLNASMALLLAIVLWRRQAVQGYRYFVFIEFFLLTFNILIVNIRREVRVQRHAVTAWSPLRVAAVAAPLAVLFVAWQLFDLQKLEVMSAGRGMSFQRFEAMDLSSLRGTYGIAWDVGMIGYFSGATILDGNGLVNGPAVARMSGSARLREFVDSHEIRFAFVDESEMAVLRGFIDLSDWNTKASFDFPNMSGRSERHYLMVRGH
jgi:hypothetical protein